MGENPPRFIVREKANNAKELIHEIEKEFDIIKLPKRLKVKFGSYILVGNAESWWCTLFEVYYGEE